MTDQLKQYAKEYGPLAAIALFLVYQLAFANSSVLAAITDTLNAHVADSNRLLYRVCLNTAKGDPDLIAGCQEQTRR